jgi:Na+-transporting NADH:ubiquinone oxidoreductase subunit A
LIPQASLERAIAPRILPVPLMRALSIGDSEAARRLGCLALVEEDVAILSRLCTSGADYGALLRQVLDELMEDAA